MRNVSLNGKVALVTGAARGIGAAIVQDFVARGAKVIATDVLTELGEQSVAGYGDAAAFCPLDVTRPEQWDAAFDFAASRFGPVTILVNNAGIEATGFIAQYDEETFKKLFDVNVYGTFLGIKRGLQHMSRANGGAGGAILNLSSMAHLIQQPCFGPYGATKSAVVRLTETMAAELKKDGININCVLPGTIDTEGNRTSMPKADHSRWVPPEAIAGVILFLASDAAWPINGAAVPVYGQS